ncbi:MAG TPA: DUF177 domain-containing protein [Thermoanaerobaculia bacterium]|nr:DUF177 domain-containing protein [Thermoanaerobaculia bacterium]
MERPEVIPLEQVLDEPAPFVFDLDVPASGLGREPLLEVSPVHFEGEVARIERGYSLQGRLAYGGKLECSRCLAAYPFQQQDRFTLVLYKRATPEQDERQLDRTDLDAYFYDQPEVPVRPIVEERIQLAVPMKPLCSEECLGLCPRCGADRNRAACGCVTETADPRWEALKPLAGSRQDKASH